MKKLINDPVNFIDEMLDGLYTAHSGMVRCAENKPKCLITKNKKEKVALVTGGGSGHLPLFLGYVGDGMLDGCAIGGIFQSPSADDMISVTRAVDSGRGVLYIIGNYNGDKLNFRLAADTVEMEDDIQTATVIGADDVASGPKPEPGTAGIRRGVAGIFFIYKCAGAAADEGLSLNEVRAVAQRAADNVRTMGVALSPCIVPRVGTPSFAIADDEMEIGMGIHGEAGIRRCQIMPAADVVREMMDKILLDGEYIAGDTVAVLINGLGATPLEEQYLLLHEVKKRLDAEGIRLYRSYVGEFATSLEMAGASVSLFKLDEQLKKYLDHPVNTPFFRQL